MKYIRRKREIVDAVFFTGFVRGEHGEALSPMFREPMPEWLRDALTRPSGAHGAMFASVVGLCLRDGLDVQTIYPGRYIVRFDNGSIMSMSINTFKSVYEPITGETKL